MAKLINDPHRLIPEELAGVAAAYPRLVALAGEHAVVRAAPKAAGRVGLCIGHGGGHGPSMYGFVGPGLLDADVIGEVFACATAQQILGGIQAADRGAGVLLLISNHEGDVLNGKLAVSLARSRGIAVRPVVLWDDVATAPPEAPKDRRGLAGLIFAVKMAGAAAEAGAGLDEVARVAEQARDATRTLAVALAPGTHPVTGARLFELAPGEMAIGMGVHGEAGVYRGPRLSADATMDRVAAAVLDDLPCAAGDGVIALLNGYGGTTLMELHILFRRLAQILAGRGLRLRDGLVGEYITVQETAGFSLSLCRADDELWDLWRAPAAGPCFHMP